MAKQKAKRTISAEARDAANYTRHMRSIFNRYLGKLVAPEKTGRTIGREAKIEQIKATLAAGTKTRMVPDFKNGERVGSKKATVPLLPADRVTLLTQAERLAKLATAPREVDEGLHREFLSILGEYAETQGHSIASLRAVGVPEADLIHAFGAEARATT